jgi:hypothetical protein
MQIRQPESRGRKPRYRAQAAAVEKSLSRYLHLVCGHMVAVEVAQLYDFAPHQLGTYFCEYCEQFHPRIVRPKVIENTLNY